MEYIAFVVGCIVSWITVRKFGQLLLGLWFHRNFMSEEKYMQLYATLDDEFFYDMFKQSNTKIKKYADYLRIHQDTEDKAYERFVEQIGHVKKAALQYGVFIVALGLVFLFNSLWYFLPILVSFAGYFTYEIKIKDHGRLFNVLWVLGLVLQDKNNSPTSSDSKK